jgi:hypothetical protein
LTSQWLSRDAYMQRRSVVTFVCFGYLAYCVVILRHGLVSSIARPRGHLASWLICATLGLLCYGMWTHRGWARGLGLAVGIASLPLWGAAILWGYAFSGFSSKSGAPTFYSPVWGIVPPILLSIALIVLLVRPLTDEPGQ